MNCPKCGRPIPPDKLGCLACVEKAVWDEARALAGRQALGIASGRLDVRLINKSKVSKLLPPPVHIGLANHPYAAWCGKDLRGDKPEHPDHDLKHPEYKSLDQARVTRHICTDCIRAIDELARKAKVA